MLVKQVRCGYCCPVNCREVTKPLPENPRNTIKNHYLRAMRETVLLRNAVIGYREHGGTRKVAGPLRANLFQGELTCLLGGNGMGKSTLLRTLVGELPLLEGDILLARDGTRKSLASLSARQRAQLVGVVFTNGPETTRLTVEEVVKMGRQPYTGFWGRLTAEDRRAVEDASRLVGIHELLHREINTLSDGERQKVMIAKALAQRTPIILLDEPTAFLDFPSKVELLQLLRRLAHEEKKTVLLSTHDLELALRLADRLWLMERHRGLRVGTPRELADCGALSRYIERGSLRFDTHDLSILIAD